MVLGLNLSNFEWVQKKLVDFGREAFEYVTVQELTAKAKMNFTWFKRIELPAWAQQEAIKIGNENRYTRRLQNVCNLGATGFSLMASFQAGSASGSVQRLVCAVCSIAILFLGYKINQHLQNQIEKSRENLSKMCNQATPANWNNVQLNLGKEKLGVPLMESRIIRTDKQS